MKNKIISISFFLLLISFLTLNILIADKRISETERRYLAEMPKLELNNVMDRSYMEKLEKYTLDQFILRDNFRALKANINYKFLLKLDNNGIYLKDNYIFKMEKTTNLKSITNFTLKINQIIEMLKQENKLYYAIIPDKNYYLNDELFVKLDYDLLYNTVKANLAINYIEINDLLDLNDYYETDTHWKQENIIAVAKRLADNMGFVLSDAEFVKMTDPNFYGVYSGQYAVNRKPETITYLQNKYTASAMVKYYDNKNFNSVYTFDKLASFDKYEVFLAGASSFIEIVNPDCKNSKELVIFRDSFASSITPLLIGSYEKITLIDTRYIAPELLSNLIEFTNQDILFLYSTLIINNSGTLKG